MESVDTRVARFRLSSSLVFDAAEIKQVRLGKADTYDYMIRFGMEMRLC